MFTKKLSTNFCYFKFNSIEPVIFRFKIKIKKQKVIAKNLAKIRLFSTN